MKFQSIERVENNKYLWDVIDVLRNELSIAEDGHVDYVDCIDKLKDEIKELKRIKAEKQVFLADAYVKKSEVMAENMKLKDTINSLNGDVIILSDKNKIKADKIKAYKSDNHINSIQNESLIKDNDILKTEIKRLEDENDEMVNELIKNNIDKKSANKSSKWLADKNEEIIKKKDNEINELKLALVDQNDDIKSLSVNSPQVDKLIIDDLKEEIQRLNKRIPKEYKKEADEYFHHNPQAEKLYFFIKDDDDCINEDIERDDAICIINNDNL